MANDVRIEGGEATAKVRNPWLVLLFTVITLGIYGFFWWYFVNREIASLGRRRGTERLGTSPTTSLVAYLFGSFITVPLIWTIVTTNRRIQRAQAATVGKSLNGWVSAALWIFTLTLGGMVYMQWELNKVWRAPGMRPEEPIDTTLGDAERADKLEELRSAGVLNEAEFQTQQRRLGLV